MGYWGTGGLEEKIPIGVCRDLILAKHQAPMKAVHLSSSATIAQRREKKINEGLMI